MSDLKRKNDVLNEKETSSKKIKIDHASPKVKKDDKFVILYENEISHDKSHVLFHKLAKFVNEQTKGKADKVQVMGKTYDEPRLAVYCSKKKSQYSYSNQNKNSVGWLSDLDELVKIAEELCGSQYKDRFTRAVINYYRNGDDSVSEHRDRDALFTPVVSFSFYPNRTDHRSFFVKYDPLQSSKQEPLDYGLVSPKKGRIIKSYDLHQGSVLVMPAGTQQLFKHGLKKNKKIKTGRINVTLRCEEN